MFLYETAYRRCCVRYIPFGAIFCKFSSISFFSVCVICRIRGTMFVVASLIITVRLSVSSVTSMRNVENAPQRPIPSVLHPFPLHPSIEAV